MRVVGVIPVRWDSRRWPGKALADVDGRPLVEWAWLSLTQAEGFADVLVATDDERIAAWADGVGAHVVMTSPECRNGTERVTEIARAQPADLYVNVQADQTGLEPRNVERLIEALAEHTQWPMATIARVPGEIDRIDSPDAVFTSLRQDSTAEAFWRGGVPERFPERYYRHLGVYAYRAVALAEYVALEPSASEVACSLEQLRGHDAGWSIGVEVVSSRARSHDRPEVIEHTT